MGEPPKIIAVDPMLEEALANAEAGLAVFPVNGKVPFKGSRGVYDASTDPARVREMWAQRPGANIAIVCGALSGIIVVDDDSDEARAELAALERQHGPLPPTATAKTRRGNHRYLSIPSGATVPHKGKKVGSPLEIISDRHYVVAPPSVHPDGNRYEWNDIFEFADAPRWLIEYAIEQAGSPSAARVENRLTAKHIPRLAAAGLAALDNPEPYSERAEARIRDALRCLSADTEENWFHRAAEIHSLNWGEKGYEILDEWSKTTKCYNYDPNKNRKRWLSLRFDHQSKRTISSLFYEAKERGWNQEAFERMWHERSKSGDEGVSHQAADTPHASPEQGLKTVRGDELLATPAPPRRWLVERFVPAAEVTLLGGDGAIGKSTLALQLGIACVSGGDWLGLKVNACNVIYASAEDPTDDVHFRLEEITRHLQISRANLERFWFIDLAGDEATALAMFERNGSMKPTARLHQIEAIAKADKIGLIIFDAAADFFGGDENDRREVRAFIGMLRGLAMRLDAAVILIAHPSVEGMKTGRGYSGSTHWNNAVRSRLYFTEAEREDGAPPNPDLRVVELAKANRARRGEKINVMWADGRFVVLTAAKAESLASENDADEVFLRELGKLNRQDMRVGPNRSSNYAPTIIARRQGGKEVGKNALERSMHRLLEAGKIRIERHGPPSKQRQQLVVSTQVVPGLQGRPPP